MRTLKSRIIEVDNKQVKMSIIPSKDLDEFESKVRAGVESGITKNLETTTNGEFISYFRVM